MRHFLYPLSLLYGLATWLRRLAYSKKILPLNQVNVPVIAVGNLCTGGTGKTPMIEYLVRLLQQDYKVAVLSRGYGRRTKGFLMASHEMTSCDIGDEPLQLLKKFPGLAIAVCEDRYQGAIRLLEQAPDISLILLDDGFQQLSLQAGLNILLTDYSHRFYSDHLLPVGNLRQPRSGYRRADIIIVTKCPLALPLEIKNHITRRIKPLPHQYVLFSTVANGYLRDFFTGQDLHLPARSHVLLLTGIARPALVESYLKSLYTAVRCFHYPDHHEYSTKELIEIKTAFDHWMAEPKLIITTEKDAARLGRHHDRLALWRITIGVLPISLDFLHDEGLFHSIVTDYIQNVYSQNKTA